MKLPNDPAAAAAVSVFLIIGVIAAIAVAGIILVPIVAIGGVGYGIYWYVNREPPPTPLTDIYTAAVEHVKATPEPQAFLDTLITGFLDRYRTNGPVPTIGDALIETSGLLYDAEEFRHIPAPPDLPDELERAQYKEDTLARVRKVDSFRTFTEAINQSINAFTDGLPAIAKVDLTTLKPDSPSPTYTVALADILDDKSLITDLVLPYYSAEARQAGLFTEVRDALDRNMHEASGVRLTPETRNTSEKLILPERFDGTFSEAVAAYLTNTPFEHIFEARVPLSIPERLRFEHTAIVAGSGWGKTQLLQSLIADDLQKDDPPGMVILDSTGAMVQRIQKLAIFDQKFHDRILIIDPVLSPSLNMFDISPSRLEGYSAEQREDMQTEIISLFTYIFASKDYDLTSQMGVAFAYAVRLMLSRPGSTITDLRRLLEESPRSYEGSAFKDDIERLDPDARDFFAHHFFAEALKGTRASVARRIHSLTAVPAFRRMFTASRNSLDLFTEMQKGTIVLVNTNQSLLKDDGMALFGCYVVARTLAAALERAVIPEAKRRPAFLIIDEAAPYFDDSFEKLLTRVRQYKLGVVIAFQHLEQASDKLRSALAANTSIKYAGGVGYNDRRWLAHDMETSVDFIAAQRKDSRDPPKWTQFSLYARNYTPRAVSVTLPFGRLESMPRMSDLAHDNLLHRNELLISPPAPVSEPAAPEPEAVAETVRPDSPAEPSETSTTPDPGEPSSDWK